MKLGFKKFDNFNKKPILKFHSHVTFLLRL